METSPTSTKADAVRKRTLPAANSSEAARKKKRVTATADRGVSVYRVHKDAGRLSTYIYIYGRAHLLFIIMY